MSSRPQADPNSVEEALARSLHHARNALSEALLSASALLDAISLATSQSRARRDPRTHSSWESLASTINGLAGKLAGQGSEGTMAGILGNVLEALDAEIARWEARAGKDPEARSVLRAFLALREILWEIRSGPASHSTRPRGRSNGSRPTADDDSAGAPQRARVQRVRVKG